MDAIVDVLRYFVLVFLTYSCMYKDALEFFRDQLLYVRMQLCEDRSILSHQLI